jgi:hypothetical protein
MVSKYGNSWMKSYPASKNASKLLLRLLKTLTVDGAMTACWDQATRHERYRVLTLIDNQLEQLGAAGMNAILLRTLRGVVADG